MAIRNSKAGSRLSYKYQCVIKTTTSGGKKTKTKKQNKKGKFQDTLGLGRRMEINLEIQPSLTILKQTECQLWQTIKNNLKHLKREVIFDDENSKD